VRSGGWPIASNGTVERFTQAVRIPAALAPTLSNQRARSAGTVSGNGCKWS
jgi:hypothetical protein